MTRFATLFFITLLGLRVAMAATHEVTIRPREGKAVAPQSLPALRLSAAAKASAAARVQPAALGAYTYHYAGAAPQLGTGYLSSLGLITGPTPLGQTPLPGLSLYPNPARSQTNLQVSGPGGADYKVRLSNVLGSEVRRLPVRPDNAPAPNGVALDLSDLPPGLYFCSLLVNDKTLVTKRLTVL